MAEAFAAAGFAVRTIADPNEPPHLLRLERPGMRIDLLVAVVEYQQVALERSIDRVLTAEDVVVHKLIAWRERDRNDIVSILRAGVSLDESYIEHWAREWDVVDRWQEARRSR